MQQLGKQRASLLTRIAVSTFGTAAACTGAATRAAWLACRGAAVGLGAADGFGEVVAAAVVVGAGVLEAT